MILSDHYSHSQIFSPWTPSGLPGFLGSQKPENLGHEYLLSIVSIFRKYVYTFDIHIDLFAVVLCYAPPQLLNRVLVRTSCTMMPPPPPVFLGQPEFIYDQHDVNIVRLVIRQTNHLMVVPGTIC